MIKGFATGNIPCADNTKCYDFLYDIASYVVAIELQNLTGKWSFFGYILLMFDVKISDNSMGLRQYVSIFTFVFLGFLKTFGI